MESQIDADLVVEGDSWLIELAVSNLLHGERGEVTKGTIEYRR